MLTNKPPITNFTPFHVTRVALLRQQREIKWLEQAVNKPKLVKLDGSGVVREKKPRTPPKSRICLPPNFASMHPDIQKIILQQMNT